MSTNLDITTHDFGNICRTCLSRNDLNPLYEKCSSSTCLVDMLMTCTFVKFAEDDGLPERICTNCIHEINKAFLFAKHCETTDAILQNCVKILETEMANNSSQFQTIQPIIKAEEEIQIKPEIILSNMHQTVKEDLEDYENVEIKQEKYIENIKLEEHLEEIKQEENVEEIKQDNVIIEYVDIEQEKNVKLENEYDETFNNPTDTNYEEDLDDNQDETNSVKSDNLDSRRTRRFTSFQIVDKSLTNKNGFSPVKKRNQPAYYQCNMCFEKFLDFKDLKKHREESNHSGNRYTLSSCPVCKKVIRHRNMKQHMRTHTGEKPYCCEICGINFTQDYTLRRHKHTQHSGTTLPKYQCQICHKSFKRLDLLKDHQKKEKIESKSNTPEYNCQTCDKSFKRIDLLRAHQWKKKKAKQILTATF